MSAKRSVLSRSSLHCSSSNALSGGCENGLSSFQGVLGCTGSFDAVTRAPHDSLRYLGVHKNTTVSKAV